MATSNAHQAKVHLAVLGAWTGNKQAFLPGAANWAGESPALSDEQRDLCETKLVEMAAMSTPGRPTPVGVKEEAALDFFKVSIPMGGRPMGAADNPVGHPSKPKTDQDYIDEARKRED